MALLSLVVNWSDEPWLQYWKISDKIPSILLSELCVTSSHDSASGMLCFRYWLISERLDLNDNALIATIGSSDGLVIFFSVASSFSEVFRLFFDFETFLNGWFIIIVLVIRIRHLSSIRLSVQSAYHIFPALQK